MNSLFNTVTMEKIKKARKVFLWAAVFILISEILIGAMMILTQQMNVFVGRVMGTLALCAIVFFAGVNNFSRMEKGERIVQSFALVSLITNIIWLLLATMLIWEIIPFVGGVGHYGTSLSVMTKIMLMAVNIAVMSFLISNVWSIKETSAPVRPLKITAAICELYCGIYGVVVTLGDVRYMLDSRWYALAGLMGFAFIVTACAAAIISNNSGKKDGEKASASGINNDAAMQARIQEMVEKEVQARLNVAQSGGMGAGESQSLQSDGGSQVAQPAKTVDEASVAQQKDDAAIIDSFGKSGN